MAKKFSTASGAVDALLHALDGGVLKLYSGPQPANADSPVPADAVLLVEADFKNPGWQRALNSRAVSHAITSNGSLAPGRVDWGRAVTADGVVIFDFSVGPTEGDFDLWLPDAIPSKFAGVVLTLTFELPSAGAANTPPSAANALRARELGVSRLGRPSRSA